MNNILAVACIVLIEMVRRKDFYVLFVMTVLVVLVMASAPLFQVDQAVRGVKEVCLFLIWISTLVMAIGAAARQIPAERENRTIFPLLAKPVSRGELLLGKFLGCWLACGVALFIFYLFLAVLSASHDHEMMVLAYVQALGLHWLCLAIVVAIVLLGSLVFSAPSANTTICLVLILGLLFFGRHLNVVALQQAEPARSILYTFYFFLPHLEWFDVRDLLIHQDHSLIPWEDCSLAALYGGGYTALFLFLAWIRFRRQALN